MKTKFIKAQNSVITWILAVLGLASGTSCEKYGMPAEDFNYVEGIVSSKKTEQPINGILVSSEYGSQHTHNGGQYILETPKITTISFRDPAENYNDFDTLIEFQKRGELKRIDIQLTPKEE
jgi:hypothetical protein